jgi:hypothetical protein
MYRSTARTSIPSAAASSVYGYCFLACRHCNCFGDSRHFGGETSRLQVVIVRGCRRNTSGFCPAAQPDSVGRAVYNMTAIGACLVFSDFVIRRGTQIQEKTAWRVSQQRIIRARSAHNDDEYWDQCLIRTPVHRQSPQQPRGECMPLFGWKHCSERPSLISSLRREVCGEADIFPSSCFF